MESVEREWGIRGVRRMQEETEDQREETKICEGIVIRAHWVAAAIPRSASIWEGPSFYHGKTPEYLRINERRVAF